jgi:two-component system alkaline phosphatase synthesis response regulator PhoP
MQAHVLVVDDDPDILEMIALLLESSDYKVTTAKDGIEALEKLKTEKPDLMILDLLMPRMDGFNVCRELQDTRWSRYRDMSIIILTSVREEASRRRYELETGLRLDVDDYLEKPVKPEILIERVEMYANKKKKV